MPENVEFPSTRLNSIIAGIPCLTSSPHNNPAIDIFVNVDHVEPTRKICCSAPKRDPGGGGINVARVAHRLGSDVAAIYPIGGAIGKLLQRLLEREGIASLVTPSHVETRENFTAYEKDSGFQYSFVLPGSRLHETEWQACLHRLASLPSAPKFVVASGSIPPGVPDEFFAQAVKHAKAMGAKTVIDTSRGALAAVLEEGVTLIKPNLMELSEYVRAPLDNDRDRVAACRKLTAAKRAEAVALTLGDQGALLVTETKLACSRLQRGCQHHGRQLPRRFWWRAGTIIDGQAFVCRPPASGHERHRTILRPTSNGCCRADHELELRCHEQRRYPERYLGRRYLAMPLRC